MKHWRRSLLVLLLATAPVIHAETLYVVEQLVVNVNSAPDASGERVAIIKSGDAVEVLEKQGDQVHVHLANGTEGWLRKSYLSAEEPLRQRLGERTAEIEKLKQDVARLEGALAAARTTPARIAPTAAKPTPTSATAPAADSPGTDSGGTADAASPDPSYFMTPPTVARPVWYWAVGSFVIALGLGYLLGWRTLDRRIRQKYGGLRIY